mgnify:CR=1 FL=1
MMSTNKVVQMARIVCLSSLFSTCGLTSAAERNAGPAAEPPRPFAFDSNAVEKVKDQLVFDERERQRPQYYHTVTNWMPSFRECDGITNFVMLSEASGDGWTTRTFKGTDSNRFVSIKVHCLKTSRSAHEMMMKIFSRSHVDPMSEVRDSSRLGDRCFVTKEAMQASFTFIRNNIYITIDGVRVSVDDLARRLDSEILALSVLRPPGSALNR